MESPTVDSVKKLGIDGFVLEGVAGGANVPILVEILIAVFEVFLAFLEEPPSLHVRPLYLSTFPLVV
jgi:hypothetical protein